MTTLKTLADARTEILKAEVAALLHNLGKLSSNFLKSVSSDYRNIYSFAWEQITAPIRTVTLVQGKSEIKNKQRLDLVKALLLAPLWGTRAKVATDLNAKFHAILPARDLPSNPKTILKRLTEASAQATAPDIALTISHDLYGAMALADLLHSNGDALWQLLDVSDSIRPGLQERFLLDTEIQLGGERHSIGALVMLMWDVMHIRDGEYGRLEVLAHWLGQSTNLQRFLITAHGSVSGTEKLGTDRKPQKYGATWRATAFGERKPEQDQFQPTDLDNLRDDLLAYVIGLARDISNLKDQSDVLNKKRRQCYKDTERLLLHGLGETRRPDNDVTLWDFVSSIASLYKPALAQQVLDGTWQQTACLRWRLLHVSFNGPAFWGQAHHVTDMTGRRKVLQDGLDAVRDILEVQYPLGNEVYRDEHGSVFVVPDRDNLLQLKDENDKPLKRLLEAAFDAQGIRGELVPEIEVSGPYKGKEIKLAQVLKKRRRKNIPKPDVAADWWAEDQRPANAEICTVCGQRPVGYPAKGSPHEQDLELDPWADQDKAEDRNVCRVCLQRRGRRAWDWTRNKKTAEEKLGPFERTIWTDEVADDNGRFALVVGRFVLDGWLDGKLIPTMRKSASFARVRRCWDTTRRFWLEVQDEELPKCVGRRLRLGLRPINVEAINHRDPKKGLGRWHTYEADVGGCRLGLCWDPNDKDADNRNLFWTTDNLRYLGRQPNLEQKALKADDDKAAEWLRHLDGHTLPLYEPGGYLGQERRANVDAEDCVVVKQEHFHPFVPLMIEPATFMALVPADKALAVAQAIKDKHDQEMARVRDRLPLHLGLVFAPRRTPLAAVLEAGRAMLTMPDGWEKWQIEAQGREATFSRDGQTFDWKYPAKMGDNQTDDVWYSHLLTIDPTEKAEELDRDAGDFCLVDDLISTVFIRPSRFDFEFLDTTARRFEITYQTSEVSGTSKFYRPSHRTRPFLLDDLERLETLWTELCYLEKSQRHQVISTIEATREAWFGADRKGQSLTDGVFHQFVRDTLAGAAWPERRRWKDICRAKTDKQLVTAGVAGELADLAELHMEILKE